uniref:Uncharacterized protein n=1 Tax=Brassica oleracea TaxID=3712 RepID=A0A3P6C9D6_BRAOL|nr:unnamed protein product [Brassica oleracea]
MNEANEIEEEVETEAQVEAAAARRQVLTTPEMLFQKAEKKWRKRWKKWWRKRWKNLRKRLRKCGTWLSTKPVLVKRKKLTREQPSLLELGSSIGQNKWR